MVDNKFTTDNLTNQSSNLNKSDEYIKSLATSFQGGDSEVGLRLIAIYDLMLESYRNLLSGRSIVRSGPAATLCKLFGKGNILRGTYLIRGILGRMEKEDIDQEILVIFLERCHLWKNIEEVPFTGYISTCYMWAVKDWLSSYAKDALNQLSTKFVGNEQWLIELGSLYTGARTGVSSFEEDTRDGRVHIIYPKDILEGRRYYLDNVLRRITRNSTVSERDIEMFQLLMDGYSHEEIGERIGMATPSVTNRLLILKKSIKGTIHEKNIIQLLYNNQ